MRARNGPMVLNRALRTLIAGLYHSPEVADQRRFPGRGGAAKNKPKQASGSLVLSSGGVPMPLTGAIPEGRSFFCPHCGAPYAVTYSRLSNSDSNVAKCVVCGQIMDQWDSTKVPIFKLIHRPEDH